MLQDPEPEPAAAPAPAPEPEPVAAPAPESEPAPTAIQEGVQALLFKTPTCPNCRAAAALLDKAGISYQPLNADAERELVAQYGVKQAPTLVVFTADGFEKYRGVSDIKGWLMKR